MLFLGSLSGKPLDVKGFIQSLPKEDKQVLSVFFEELVTTEVIFYSLLGHKPASSVCYFSKPAQKWSLLYPSLRYRNHLLKKGWEVWKKYSFLLENSSDGFLLVAHQSGEVEQLTLINQPFFLKIVAENLSSFQKAFGATLTPLSFLEDFKKEGFSLLLKHQDLIGVLYGYGMHNAKLFKRYCHLLVPSKGKMYPVARVSKDGQELRDLELQLGVSFVYREGIDRVATVNFRCDHGFAENCALLNHYKEVRGILSQLLRKKSALEIFLEVWAGAS